MNSDEQIRDTAARVIHSWRIRKEMSQSALAEKLGMHQTAIAKIENGERRIDFATVVRIADVLGIPWEEFNVTAPTDFDVFIQHFSRFQMLAKKWIDDIDSAYRVVDKLAPYFQDLQTYIGPARLKLTDEIEEDDLETALKALLQVHSTMLKTLDSLEGLKAAREVTTNLEVIDNFIAKLESAKRNAES